MTSKISVVAAVVERDGQLLLCQRPHQKRHGGLWEFPGGKLDPGETIEEAARRELREELDVDVISCGETLLSVQDAGSSFVIHFVSTVIRGTPTALEHEAIAWRSAVDAAALPLAPSDRAFVDHLLASHREARLPLDRHA